ncbi:MAG: peptide-N-glycosidase F-related protein [Bacteroidia bacterium]
MKRLFSALLCLFPLAMLAGNGDTLQVRSHDRVHMNWYGNFDKKIFFPTAGKSYQRVKMHYTLGCPDNGCSEWDYTVQAILRQPSGVMDSTLKTSPNFKVNGGALDSFFYSLDSSYSYFFNSVTKACDSTSNNPVQLVRYLNALNPTVATDTLMVWDALQFRPTYDTSGTVISAERTAYEFALYRTDYQWYQVFEIIHDLELGRLITPYAADKTKTWTFTYTYDITEFALLLKDSVTIRSHFSGYQDGFTCTIDFEFIEGEPALKCTDIIPLWSGGFPYGNQKGIEEYLVAKKVGLSKKPNTRVKMRVTQTGHGFGGNENCAEFCAKEHYVKVNGVQRYKNLVWKDNCGSNAIYPQPGTWLYDRANWCPGEAVNPYDYWLESFMVDGENTIDLDMQPFTNIDNSSNSYIVNAYLFVYEENTSANADVALEEIIAPNRKNNFVRFNPTCGLPKVRVKNTSMKKTESITFKYGVKGGNLNTWTWTGEILPYESKEIELAFFDWSGASAGEFAVSIEAVNGGPDANSFNNNLESGFELTPQYPGDIQIWFKANTKGNETTLSVHELDGRVIWSRSNFSSNQSTKDTVRLVDGCYYFKITDSERNGISFWAIPDGTGTLSLRQMSGQIILSIPGDFGTEYVQYFTVGHPLSEKLIQAVPEMKLYPNPNSGQFTLEFTAQGSGSLRLMDLHGKVLQTRTIRETGLLQSQWDLSGFASGIYLLEYDGPDGRVVQKVVVE